MPMSTTKKMKALITCPVEEMMALTAITPLLLELGTEVSHAAVTRARNRGVS